MNATPLGAIPVAQDELGNLWVNGNVVPSYATPRDTDAIPGALVFWTEMGIGLWVHPKSMRWLHSVSRLEMKQDDWLPVVAVATEWPPFIERQG